ncbi:MAG: hypothetical protein NZ941_08405 [Candidatus Caldarchaeum sp.]|nr:hypothetical protein [Candidatus Caldarchaeum sp.]
MAIRVVALALGEHPAPAMELCSLCTDIVEDYFVDDEQDGIEKTSDMLDADLLEVPVKMDIDGDFYFASNHGEATHILRIALSESGFEHPLFEQTHDIVFFRNGYENEAYVADTLRSDGWTMLWGNPKRNDKDWAVFVPYTPQDMKLFWATIYPDDQSIWLSRPAQLLPFLQAEEAVNRYRRKRKQNRRK